MTSTTDFPTWERSVQWRDDHLYLLDQTLLPGKVHWIELRTIEQVWESIRALKVRGAPAIGITAAFGLALWANEYNGDNIASFKQQLRKTRDYLASARPTAVNLFWALDRLIRTAETVEEETAGIADTHQRIAEIKRALVNEALAMQDEDEQVCRKIGEHALQLFQPNDRLLTHCNAGGLATAKYGTALAPFYIAAEKGIPLSVFACETRPVLQGARLTAWELLQSGADVTLITDNMAAHVMKTKQISAVIVGTDRVAANGDVANKIGTYGLALLAKAHNIPFYVASPISTIDLDVASGEDIPIEERASEEVTHLNGQRIAPEGIQVFNPAFDITPHELVTAIITEKGIAYGDYTNHLPSLVNG